MTSEDSLQFVTERLRYNHSPLHRPLQLHPGPRIKRRFAVQLRDGEAHRLDPVDETVMVRCAEGSVWITHDGDPKDVILAAGESYQSEREDAMHLFALQPCVLEIQFEDELLAA
jgi:hypothetical protein